MPAYKKIVTQAEVEHLSCGEKLTERELKEMLILRKLAPKLLLNFVQLQDALDVSRETLRLEAQSGKLRLSERPGEAKKKKVALSDLIDYMLSQE